MNSGPRSPCCWVRSRKPCRSPSEGLRGEALHSAHRNALRLLRLVNTLLDFSRIEAGRAQAHYVPTDLAAATQELASVFRSAMERAGLRYSVTCDALREPVFIDREMWEKIVLNLLSNAFKYTFDGEIRVEMRASDAGAELVVADTGTGIPPEALPQLFNRFYRVPGASGRTHEGSGIGLSLVRELVKLHGGSIEVESTVGRGSIFRVRIPFGAAHLPAAQVAQEATARRARAAPKRSSKRRSAGCRILRTWSRAARSLRSPDPNRRPRRPTRTTSRPSFWSTTIATCASTSPDCSSRDLR